MLPWQHGKKNKSLVVLTVCTYVDLKIPFGLDVYENDSVVVDVGMLPIFAIKGP